jgi:CDP-4-dehydro-6-deoxyglucose reductase, E3
VSVVLYQDRQIVLQPDESVLDALLRSGVAVTYSCRAGVCGSCVMRAAAGSVPPRAQAGMKDSWKACGYFYSCSCVPESDLELASAETELRRSGRILSLRLLSRDVMQARLRTDEPLDFRSGQYVTLVRDSVARSYSIASLPAHGCLELHIRKIPGGRMSGWFHDEARAGDRVSLIGPSGECFYLGGREDQPLILAGTGTGLAPLYGIVRDALAKGHHGPIHLFHGAADSARLYFVDELMALAAQHANLQYIPAVLEAAEQTGLAIGPLDEVIRRQLPNLKGWRGFVCGGPRTVQTLKKKLFLAGIASRDIYSDAFLPAAV